MKQKKPVSIYFMISFGFCIPIFSFKNKTILMGLCHHHQQQQHRNQRVASAVNNLTEQFQHNWLQLMVDNLHLPQSSQSNNQKKLRPHKTKLKYLVKKVTPRNKKRKMSKKTDLLLGGDYFEFVVGGDVDTLGGWKSFALFGKISPNPVLFFG